MKRFDARAMDRRRNFGTFGAAHPDGDPGDVLEMTLRLESRSHTACVQQHAVPRVQSNARTPSWSDTQHRTLAARHQSYAWASAAASSVNSRVSRPLITLKRVGLSNT